MIRTQKIQLIWMDVNIFFHFKSFKRTTKNEAFWFVDFFYDKQIFNEKGNTLTEMRSNTINKSVKTIFR